MIEVKVYNLNGQVKENVELPEALFGAKIVRTLMHEVVRAEEAARRQGTVSTKTRGEVRGGGKKPWKQKGTGRARHGSSRSPIWVGGGTTFGPRPRDYTVKVNRKVRKAALASALSARMGEERVVALSGEGLEAPKTQQVAGFLGSFEGIRRPLLIHAAGDDILVRSFRNIGGSAHKNLSSLNVRTILKSDFVILTEGAIKALKTEADSRSREAQEASAETEDVKA